MPAGKGRLLFKAAALFLDPVRLGGQKMGDCLAGSIDPTEKGAYCKGEPPNIDKYCISRYTNTIDNDRYGYGSALLGQGVIPVEGSPVCC